MSSADPDVAALAVDAVRAQMGRLEAGRLRLRLPARASARAVAGQHRHTYPELGIYLRGRSTLACADETVDCRAGDVLLVPSGTPHREDFDPERGCACVLFHHWERALGFHLALPAATAQGWRVVGTRILPHPGTAALAHRLDEVAEAAWRHGPTHATCRGLLLAWFGEVLEALASAPAPDRVPLLDACRQLVARHAAEPDVGTAWLARRLGCNPDHLGRVLRAATGRTVLDLVAERRLALAEQALADRELPIARVATACGFASSAYFCRWFARRHGLSPGAWRRRARARR
jgi:AraC-like DNA-binding protein